MRKMLLKEFIGDFTENDFSCFNPFCDPFLADIWRRNIRPDVSVSFFVERFGKEMAALPVFIGKKEVKYLFRPVWQTFYGGEAWRSGLCQSGERGELEFYGKFFDYIAGIKDWDMFVFNGIENAAYDMIRENFISSGKFSLLELGRNDVFVINVNDDFKIKYEKYKRKKRYRKRMNKFLRRFGRFDCRVYDSARCGDMEFAVKTIMSVSDKSWKAKDGTHINSESKRKYYKETFDYLATKGGLLIYLLYADEVPIAFSVGYRYYDKLFLLKSSYDSAYAYFSPGIMVTDMLLEDLLKDRSVDKVDFTSSYAYMRNWPVEIENYVTFALFNGNFFSKVLYFCGRGYRLVKKSFLEGF